MLTDNPDAALPAALFTAFQLFFACVTTALVAGAAAGRMKFGAWMVFAGVWATLVYFPIAHWVFAFSSADGSVTGGWIANGIKAIDFAGGTAVHMNAGAAALALALVLGRSSGWPKMEHSKPHSRPLVLVGAGLLWVGWFGFNAGSALTAGHSASVVFLNTAVAASAGLLAWALVERIRHGATTSMGAASGLVSALVAITPACGAVSPLGAVAIGAIAGAVCSLAIEWKFRLGFDDSLDVVGVHLVGGIIGTLLIGIFATDSAPERRQRPAVRRRAGAAGHPVTRDRCRAGLLLRPDLGDRQGGGHGHGPAHPRRGRTARHRPRRPLRVRLPDRRRPREPGRLARS